MSRQEIAPNSGVYLTEVKRSDGGCDFFLDNVGAAEQMVRLRWDAAFNVTAKLFGDNTVDH